MAYQLAPNYDTLSWIINLAFCGSRYSYERQDHSISQPFIVMSVAGPKYQEQVYIHSLPDRDEKSFSIPLSDTLLQNEPIAELFFKGLDSFCKSCSFILLDNFTGKRSLIKEQTSVLIKPKLNKDYMKVDKPDNISRFQLQINFNE